MAGLGPRGRWCGDAVRGRGGRGAVRGGAARCWLLGSGMGGGLGAAWWWRGVGSVRAALLRSIVCYLKVKQLHMLDARTEIA